MSRFDVHISCYKIDAMSNRTIFGRYKLEESLSETRVASVYTAIDLQFGKKVVVKLVSGGSSNIESQQVKRFLSEIALLQTLNHPGVIKVFDNGQDNGDLFYVMEFIPGKPLSPEMNLSLEPFVDIFLDIAEIIGYLHSKGIIHRDIKPSNIMVLPKRDENGKIAKIIDYGLAKFSEDGRITSQGMIIGTLNFMAPELLLKYGVDFRSDLYSLGASMFHVLTEKFPFEVTNLKKMAFGSGDESVYDFSKSTIPVPKSLSNLIVKLLSKNMDERPAKIEEVVDILQSIKTESISKDFQKSISICEPELIGRGWEIRNIQKIWDESTSSEIVMVRAPFGFGKSRLLEEVSLRLFLNRSLVIRARGFANSVSYDGSGLIQVIFELSQLNPDYTRFIDYREVLSSVDDKRKESYIAEIVASVREFIKSFKEKVTIVIDDFHLFDSVSMNSFFSLVFELDNVFLLVSSDILADDYSAVLDLKGKVEYFDLDVLEGSTYIKFIQACLGTKNIPSKLYFDIIKYCKGNPLFTLELLRLMVQEEAIFFEEDFIKYDEKEGIFTNPDYLPSISVSLMGISDKASIILGFLALGSTASTLSKESIRKSLKIPDFDILSGIEELKKRRLISTHKKGLEEEYSFNIEILRTSVIARIADNIKSMMELEHANRILESKIVDSELVFDVGLHFLKSGEQYRSVAYFIHYLWYQIYEMSLSRDEIDHKIACLKNHTEFRIWQLIQDIADSMHLQKIGKSKEAKLIIGKYKSEKNASSTAAGIVLTILRVLSGELEDAKKIIKRLITKVRYLNIDEFSAQIYYAQAMIGIAESNVIAVHDAIKEARYYSLKTGGYNTIGISKIMISSLIDLLEIDEAKKELISLENLATERSINSERNWIARVKSVFSYAEGKISDSLSLIIETNERGLYKGFKSPLTNALVSRLYYYLGRWDELLDLKKQTSKRFERKNISASNVMIDYFSDLIHLAQGRLIEAKIDAARLMNDSSQEFNAPKRVVAKLIEGSSEFYSGNEKIAYSDFLSSFNESLELKQPGLIIDTSYHFLTIPKIEFEDSVFLKIRDALIKLMDVKLPLLYKNRFDLCISILNLKLGQTKLEDLTSLINHYLAQLRNESIRENLIYTSNIFVHLAGLYNHLAVKSVKDRKEEIEKMLFGAEFIWQVLNAKQEISNIMWLRKQYLN